MKNLFYIFPIILAVAFACNTPIYAHEHEDLEFFHPVKITKEKPLNLTDCVSLAYQNSPKIRRQKYNLDIAKSRVGVAKSGYFPVINAGVGFYNENNSNSVYYDRHYRDLPSVGVSINKMVWDFGKTTANIKMEEFYKIGAEYEFMDSLCSTLFDVKWKYYNLLRAQALVEIYKENLKIAKQIYDKATKSPDKETAKVYETRAKILLKEAENNYKNAKLDLDNSMYLANKESYTISDTNTFSYNLKDINNFNLNVQTFPFERENAPKIAYKNSPDLHVLIATKRAMEQSLKYIKRTYLPELDANVGYGFNNTLRASNNSLQVGVALNSSVNLMELKHNIKGAEANVYLAQNEIDLFKKDLYYNIYRAFNNVDKALSQITLAKEKVEESSKALEIVSTDYYKDLLDYTTINDAREDFITSNVQYVNSLYEYNTALIQVEMAMHCHITDIHHKSGHAIHHHSDELISNLIKALECTQTPKAKRKSKLFVEESSIEDEDL